MARVPLILGAYELLERIAEGGMAEVWKARAKGASGFEKTVVIKRVLPALMSKPGFADLLVREAKISARLSHPNIAQVFELGEEGGTHYIAMEYVHGKDLGQAMAFRGAGDGLSLPLRIWVMSEVAKALEHAHSRRGDDGRPMQIVHRDVSPQNVLLGYEGEVKVADFGIARADEAGLGRGEDPKILRGKYAYMSPEQARGEPLDRRSDLFALGVVLFEVLSGTRLFRGKTSQETLSLVRQAHVPALGPAGIDKELQPIVLKCLALNRDERYAAAGELYRDLAGWLFRRGELVGEPNLAEAMARMFPPEEAVAPNKLRVDLMLRAYQDATAMSSGPLAEERQEGADRTAAFPMSRRARIDRRRMAYLFADARDADERSFVEAVDRVDGQMFRILGDLRVAAFGQAAGVERPALLAVRAAMEFQKHARLEAVGQPPPRMVVVDGEGRVADGVVLEPEDEVLAAAEALLVGCAAGETRIRADLVPEIESAFRVRIEGGIAEVEAFRGRHERAAGEIKRLPLVGRREELRQLTELLVLTFEAKEPRKGNVVRLIGEAGVGKSRLVGELRSVAAPSDFTFIYGKADEAEQDHPYALFADIVRDIAGTEREDAPQERFAKIDRLRILGLETREVRLLGELLGLHYPTPTRLREGRPRGIELALALRKAIAALANDRAVVLQIEDTQWCDDESRQLLPMLVRGLSRTRTLVLATSRPGSITPNIGGRAIRVAPLGLESTSRLAAVCLGAREAPADLCVAVHEETGGLPAWIGIAIAEGRDEGGSLLREGAPPPAIARQVEARLEGLDPLERAVLTTASAFGTPIPVELLVSIEGLVGDTGHGIVRRLLARRLLVEGSLTDKSGDSRRPPSRELRELREREARGALDPSLLYPLGRWGGHDERDLPKGVRPASGYVRRTALSSMEADARGPLHGRLHDRILSALERIPPDEQRANASSPERQLSHERALAYHAARGSDRRRAPDYLRAAADSAERIGVTVGTTSAYLREAAEHCLTAVRILREDELDPDHAHLVPLALRGLDLALTAYEPALATALVAELQESLRGDKTPEDAACLLLAEGRMILDRDDPHEVVRRLDAARTISDEAKEPWPSRIALLLARALIGAGRLEPARAALRRAAEGFGKIGDTLQEGRALALRADIEARLGALDDARSSAARVLALAARHGDAQVRADSLAAMGAEREASGDHLGALDRFREAIEVASHARLDADTVALSLRAALAALRARVDAEAGSRAHTAMEGAKRRKLEAAQLLGSAVQSAIAAHNYPDAAYSLAISRHVERLEAMNRPLELAACLELLARTEMALGRTEEASAAADRAMGVAHAAGWRVLGRILGR